MDDNILLLNSFFDKYENELYIVLKDVETGKKFVKKEENPKIPVYIVKDDEPVPEYFMEYRNEAELNQFDVSYRFREWELARILPGYDTFTDDVRNGTINKEHIYLDRKVFGADVNINDRMIMDYLDAFGYENEEGETVYPDTPPIENIHMGYFDLEWDIKKDKGEKVFNKNYPIYLMTYVDAKTNECITYYLIDDEYDRQDEIMNNTDDFIDDLKDKMNDFYDNIEGKSKTATRQIKNTIFKRLEKMKYVTKAYHDEEMMIRDFYNKIFIDKKPDFLFAFNTSADITQTELRAKKLGIELEDLFTHPDLGDYIWFNKRDNTFKPDERRHNYDCASYTKVMDMMLTYYSVRSFQNFTQYSLAATATRELGIGKLDYSHVSETIEDLPYNDFVVATQYNIIDVLSMVFIEDMIEDIKTILTKKFITRTNYDRMFVSMPSVMNTFYHIAERNGQILSNNVNSILLGLTDRELQQLKTKDKRIYKIVMAIKNGDTISGGLCSDPNLVINEGHNLFPFLKNYKLHHSIIDADASSMYPNNIITGNISKSTLIGKIVHVGSNWKGVTERMPLDGHYLKITEDEWETTKTKKSKQKHFEEIYKAAEEIGYTEDVDGNLFIDIDDILEIYDTDFMELITISDGSIIDEDRFLELKPTAISEDKHKMYNTLLHLYLKKVTSKIGEKAILPMIQKDIINIGKEFFNLPDLEELEGIINDNYPDINIYSNTAEFPEVEGALFKSTSKNSKLLTLLGNLDSVSLTKQDRKTGTFNTNGMFLIDTKPTNELSLYGKYVKYYLESKTPISEYFDVEKKVYTNRQGEDKNHVYKKQSKPKNIPNLKEENLVVEDSFTEDDLELLRETGKMMRRFDFYSKELDEDITLNLLPRMIPVIKRLDSLDIKIYKTEHEDIYDANLISKTEIESGIDDSLIVETVIRILNY